jgi:hypothetical protein
VKPALTFVIQYGILDSVPIRNERPREAKRPWHRAKGLALVIPKGDIIMPMKKPVRLLGVVFQIDK